MNKYYKEYYKIAKSQKHRCRPREIKTLGLPSYQCGCGRYFTKEQYKKTRNPELQELIEANEEFERKKKKKCDV